MKKLMNHVLIISFITLPLFLMSCGLNSQKAEEDLVIHSNAGFRKIVPAVHMETDGAKDLIESETMDPRETTIPHIDIDENFQVIQLFNVNLDEDLPEEQIILLKYKDGSVRTFYISIIDFEEENDTYIKLWDGPTLIDSLQTFSLDLVDITGDHKLEIICKGIDHEGAQTINIFSPVSTSGQRYVIRPVFEMGARGSIEIDYHERDNKYVFEGSSGESFPIYVQMQDSDSENPSDLVKYTYTWNNYKKAYEISQIDKIPGEAVLKKHQKDIARGDQNFFLQYLHGSWIRIKDMNNVKLDTKDSLTFFDSPSRNVIFHLGSTLEPFKIKKTYKTIPTGLYIRSTNEMLPDLRNDLNITAYASGEIRIKATYDDSRSGYYVRTSDDFNLSLLGLTRSTKLSELQLSGVYQGSNGDTLNFELPFFSWQQTDTLKKGSSVIFEMDKTYIEFQFMSDDGLNKESRIYILEYTEKEDQARLLKTLYLIPGKLDLSGITPNSNDRLHFEQIEILAAAAGDLTADKLND